MLRPAACLVGALLLAPLPVHAHHHIGCVYDTTSTQAVSGRIVEIVWKMPHVHVAVRPVGGAGDGALWDIETIAPSGLERVGIARDTFRVDDALTLTVWRAKDGSRQAFTQSVTLSTGKTVPFPIADLTCPF